MKWNGTALNWKGPGPHSRIFFFFTFIRDSYGMDLEKGGKEKESSRLGHQVAEEG